VYGKTTNLIKLGYSSNVTQRLQQYYSHNPAMELIGTYYKENAEEFESKLHKVVKSEIMNEWYSDDMLPLILSYINGLELPVKEVKAKKTNFSNLCKQYSDGDDKTKLSIEKLEPLIKEAINTLGKEKMKALNFEKGQIQAELIKVNDLKSNEWKIASLLKYNVGQFITLADVKTKLQSIYDRLEINKKAVATDINQYFETKNQSKRTGSSVVQGMVIINKKFKNK
jgi:hypothetical protein